VTTLSLLSHVCKAPRLLRHTRAFVRSMDKETTPLASSVAATLDRASFSQQITVAAVRVPASSVSEYISNLRPHLLNLKKHPNVVSDPTESTAGAGNAAAPASAPAPSTEKLSKKERKANRAKEKSVTGRLVLLSQQLALPSTGNFVESLKSLPEEPRQWIESRLSDPAACTPTEHTVTLDYDYFGADDIIKQILPAGMECTTAFEQVGGALQPRTSTTHIEPHTCWRREVVKCRHKKPSHSRVCATRAPRSDTSRT
jgi:hypothetical protein